MRFVVIALAGIGLWFLLGEPKWAIANWLYPDDSAPWEDVVGFYYPDQKNPIEYIESPPLATVTACRNWAIEKANEDPRAINEQSNYECAVGKSKRLKGQNIYRITIK